MCGIVGALTQRDVVEILLEGLKRLEYRGYDSAGVAVVQNDQIKRLRCEGKIHKLEKSLEELPLSGHLGIAHTRWATHGKPNELNAHPHMSSDQLAIVHNGIIENDRTIRQWLIEQGYEINSDTDSEIIAHLIQYTCQHSPELTLLEVLRRVSEQLTGAYALGVIHRDHPDKLYAVRKGSPLVIGIGVQEHFIASDMLALVPLTQQFICLEEGDIAEITTSGINIIDSQGQPAQRDITVSNLSQQSVDRGGYRHFMAKEIFEQPQAVSSTLQNRLIGDQIKLIEFDGQAERLLKQCRRATIVACGTSFNAGMIARYWLEAWLGMPCTVEIASEYRYRQPVAEPDTLFVTISQSGETADTLAALRLAKSLGHQCTLSICNVPGSSLVRESDLALMTYAGPEIGVASTKAFTTQLTALLILIGYLSQCQGQKQVTNQVAQFLNELPGVLEQMMAYHDQIQDMAQFFVDKQHALFLGRGTQYPLALEGALKLKEISYIHAEAYPAGELKHGPLALVDSAMPVVVMAPNDQLVEKIASNIKEVEARGGQLFVFKNKDIAPIQVDNGHELNLPALAPDIAPVAYTVPLQLLAYQVAVLKGTDVDKPRNLAKSVTVE